MSVASGYVHISVRNANKAGQASGLRQGFGARPAFPPAGQGNNFPAPGYAPQGYNPNSYGQLRAVPAEEAAPVTAPTPLLAPAPGTSVRPVPNDNVARGFVLYMGIDEESAAAAGTSIAKLAQEIRAYAQSLVSGAESYAAVAVAPASAQGSALDVVRSTFGDPTVNTRQRTETARLQPAQDPRPSGVLIDLARREVHLDGESLNLTFKEFELLNYLVENGTRTVGRDELLRACGATPRKCRTSGPSTSTSAASAPSWAALPTPCVPSVARVTGSTSTPKLLSGPLRNTPSRVNSAQKRPSCTRTGAFASPGALQRLSAVP
jgi:hypothetical protein